VVHNLLISALFCGSDTYVRNMLRSDGTQRSVVMSIKVYYSNQTKKILMGSEKAKADFSETFNLLKNKRFHIPRRVIFKISFYSRKYLNVYFTNLNDHYFSKIGLSNSALRGPNIFAASK